MRTAISNGSFSGGEKEIQALITQLENAGYDVEILRTNLANLKGGTDYSQVFTNFTDSTESMNAAIARSASGTKNYTAEMEKVAASAGKAATQQKSAENSFKAAGDAADAASKKIDNVGLKYKTIGDAANGSL
jgi:methyl-accepting chemotaxis protein